MDTYLTEDAIINTIKQYIGEDIYNYAVMIDGDWGSGKTYFVKETLIKKLREKFKERQIIYISLYGINSTSEIDKQIYLSKYLGGNKKTYTVASSAVSLGFDYLKGKGIKLNENNIRKMFGSLLSIESNSVLIFDDLERCHISVTEVLAHINIYIEHQDIKVILIANEKEINKSNDDNLELKYFVSSLPNIDLTEQKDIALLNAMNIQPEPEKNDIYNLSNLKERKDIIFSQKSEYDVIKEKVIGLTIRFQPNMEKYLKQIICKHVKNNIKEKLLDNIPAFIEIMNNMEHQNLRTFQFYILKVQKICEDILTLNIESEYLKVKHEFIDKIIPYTFEQCVLFKKEGFLQIYSNNNAIFSTNQISYERKMLFSSYDYLFIKKYILSSFMDKELLEKTLDEYYCQYSSFANEKYMVLKEIEHWYYLDEERVNEYCLSIKGFLAKNAYNEENIEHIVQIFLNIKYDANIDKVEEIVSLIEDIIIHDEKNRKLIETRYGHFIEKVDEKKEYIEIIEKINNLIIEHNKKINKKYLYKLFKRDSWVHELSEIARKQYTQMSDISMINIFMDSECLEIMEHVYQLDSYGIMEFRQYISILEKKCNDNYILCISRINECIEYIENHREIDKIKYMNLNYLKQDLLRLVHSIENKSN